ncbi:MAG: ABC transporter ATP-binding protein [Thermoguttaceae bacterium]
MLKSTANKSKPTSEQGIELSTLFDESVSGQNLSGRDSNTNGRGNTSAKSIHSKGATQKTVPLTGVPLNVSAISTEFSLISDSVRINHVLHDIIVSEQPSASPKNSPHVFGHPIDSKLQKNEENVIFLPFSRKHAPLDNFETVKRAATITPLDLPDIPPLPISPSLSQIGFRKRESVTKTASTEIPVAKINSVQKSDSINDMLQHSTIKSDYSDMHQIAKNASEIGNDFTNKPIFEQKREIESGTIKSDSSDTHQIAKNASENGNEFTNKSIFEQKREIESGTIKSDSSDTRLIAKNASEIGNEFTNKPIFEQKREIESGTIESDSSGAHLIAKNASESGNDFTNKPIFEQKHEMESGTIKFVMPKIMKTEQNILTSHSPLESILITEGITKCYYKSRLCIPVLKGVDFSVRTGEFVSIVGQSGSGKSTLLHILGTLDQPESGTIHFHGHRIDNLSISRRDKLRNRSIGLIFQFYHLLPELTTLENVLFPLMIRHNLFSYIFGRSTFIARAKSILDQVGLSHRLKHKPNELSGGEMQRVAIARALISEPQILFADEPTGNLDAESAKEIIQILRSLNQSNKLTIVMVTHDSLIADVADRTVKMVDGRIQEHANFD